MNNIDQFLKDLYLHSNYRGHYPVLKGVFERCSWQNELSDEYDELLDASAALLIKIHKDNSILPSIVDTIFFRNRESLFTHDLIWAFFEARDPYSLMLIANYLHSDDERDIKLACKLLDFVPSIDMTTSRDSKDKYMAFFYWLIENYRFLYFTGESFQRTSNPIPYKIDSDAKYKGASI
ncbi:hypothetical protein [Clostridium sp.]|uniref:hypothetical protein n=1 Tax=Clostridium sp. TaxID=1506 RepID=UPI003D6CB769